MKHIRTYVIVLLSLLFIPSLTSYGAKNSRKIIFGDHDAQIKKARRNLKDKIEGTIEAVNNRIDWLKKRNTGRRTSRNPTSEDELKSMALSINSDIDQAKEDVNNYMMNGDIYLSERDNYLQKLEGLRKVLADLRVVKYEDLYN